MLKKNKLHFLFYLCPMITTFLIIMGFDVFNTENLLLFLLTIFSLISSVFVLYKIFIFDKKIA
ncbi:positive regulator of sigma E activity [Myroides gitamensis]|uniref:Uncharacterized protein n=1 Tax=Myroides odoratus TaxID=256 RepID=A0A378U6N5_MYROD|nr:positive regulator of sigma E activity [Myroides odoratus]MDH6601553.1 positive regulator of sigma E activity [Myroides gitamensis]STZ70002.1 Uncharacterised protein [Myroides odoratus]